DRLAPRAVVHGVLLDVYGLGVLLLGDSGVGKSECALDLVVRGHRLVSDDVVEIKRRGEQLVGTGPELTRYHMELRGVGIINVKDLFGVASVRLTKFVEYVIKLDPWKPGKRYDRLGLDDNGHEILGVNLPYVEMPVGPGRNLSVLIEVAARNHLLKLKGYHPARELARRLGERIQTPPLPEGAPMRDREPGGGGAGGGAPRRHHSAVGIGEIARGALPRGHGLRLRGQPPRELDPAVLRAHRAQRRVPPARRHRRGRAGARVPRGLPRRAPRAPRQGGAGHAPVLRVHR